MKTNRIGSEQLLKILISEIEEIREINDSFKISLKEFTTSINKKLDTPIRIDSSWLEKNISKLDHLTGVNERNNERFIVNFDTSIRKGKKIFFWTPYILGLVTVVCLISGYYNYNLYEENQKLQSRKELYQMFFNENDKEYKKYMNWLKK